MSDVTRGPAAMAVFLGVGGGLALLVARFGDPIIAAAVGVTAFALAVRAAMGEGPPRAELPREHRDEHHGDPSPERAYDPVIGGTAFGAVFVEVGPEEILLCVFPVADPKTAEELGALKRIPPGVKGVVIFNDGDGDHLFGSRLVGAFGVPPERVWATDPTRSIDRAGAEDVAKRQAKRLPGRLDMGSTKLSWEDGVLRLRWGRRYGGAQAVLGIDLPTRALATAPHPVYVVGSVAIDDPAALGLDLFMALRHVMLVEGQPAGSQTASARFFSTLGVHATVLGARDPESVVDEWLEATREGGPAFDAKVGKTPVPIWVDVLTELAVLGEHALADARIATIVAATPDHRLYYELGISKLMQNDPTAAEPAFRRAIELGSDFARNSLANTLAHLDRLDEALEVAREACEHMPEDPITFKTSFGLHLRSGDREAAARIVSDGPWTDDQRAELRAQLDAEPERAIERFGGYAAIAKDRGTQRIDAGDFEGAEGMLRRAVRLDPLMLEAWVELAFVLGKREDDEALRAICERAIAEVPGGELLRFNLGNLAIRGQRWEEAREAFETLLEAVPTHRDARVNLVSALCALERREEALEHLHQLEAQGVEPSLLEALRVQCLARA